MACSFTNTSFTEMEDKEQQLQ